MIRVDIKGIDYTIEFVERLQDEDGEPCSGLQHWDKSLIQIESRLALEPTLVSIWHEMAHAMCDIAGIKEKDQKEQLIEAVSHGIVAVLKKNPWLTTPETLKERTSDEGLGS